MEKKLHIKLRKIVFLALALFFSSHVLIAQTGAVKGTVSDGQENLPGATIKVEGTSIGVITNMNGSYTLENVPIGEQTITASFMGYKPISKSVTISEGKTTELSFTLEEDVYTLQDVMVTASKRSERIQDVSQSISAIDGRQLDALGITDANDYIKYLPGVTVNQIEPTKVDIIIRGVSPIAGNAATVGYYVGETPISAGWQTPSVSSFDVERIEVLRGPQGTLYGEGSMGGTIKIIPNKANVNKFSVKFNPQFSVTEGFNQQYNGMVNIPIIKNKLAIRATGYYQNDAGYFNNVGLDSTKSTYANTFKKYGGRASLLYVASDKLFFTASAMYNKGDAGGRFISNDNYEQYSGIREPIHDEYEIYSLTGNYNFSFAKLTVTGSYFKQAWDAIQQIPPETANSVNELFGMFGIPPRDAIWQDINSENTSFSLEARLVSSSSGPLKWTAGAYYNKFKSDFGFISPSEPGFTQEEIDAVAGAILGTPPGAITGGMSQNNIQEPEHIAIFGEISYDITPKLNILGGVRVFKETNNYTSITDGLFNVLTTGKMPETLTGESEESVVNPKFTLTFKPIENVLTYATASRGFRRGGLNVDISMYPDVTDPYYKSESFWNYELGLKTSFINGKLVANVAFYYNDWKDMQVVTRNIVGLALIENVGKAHTTGTDFEINWMPVKGLILSANGNYTIAQTDVDIQTPVDTSPEEEFMTIPKGTDLSLIPKLTLNMYAQYKFVLSKDIFLTPRIDYNYRGENKSAVPNMLDGEKLPASNQINLRLTFDYKRHAAYLFVDNLTDERIKSNYFGNDPVVGKVYYMGRPRTIGIGFNFVF